MQTHPFMRRRGFTLLELMVVIVMIGLVSLVSFRRVGDMTTQWRVNRAAQAYGEELQAAFAIVGRDRRPVRITIDRTTMELRITPRDTILNGTYRRRNFGKTSAYKLDSADISIDPLKRTLEVYPPGLAADSIQVEISRQGKYRRIRMLRGGLVQICSNHPSLNAVCVPA
jgi:prepilin-type N-terminal cleavage/methylation domain-containing protein